jgi:hypothetical protein
MVSSDGPSRRAHRPLYQARTRRIRKIHDILRDIEREWSAELGPKCLAELKELLLRVWESPLAREPARTARGTARIG